MFLSEEELRSRLVTGTERDTDTHSASPATKALDRPARKCGEREISSCSDQGRASGLTQLPVFKVHTAFLLSCNSTQKHTVRVTKED